MEDGGWRMDYDEILSAPGYGTQEQRKALDRIAWALGFGFDKSLTWKGTTGFEILSSTGMMG